MRIGLTGSHGTGKTTTAYRLQNKTFPDAFVVDSSSRELIKNGYALGLKATPEAQLLTTVKRVNDIERASRDHEVVICDRTPLDSLAYTYYQMKHVWGLLRHRQITAPYFDESAWLVEMAMEKFDLVFFLRPLPTLTDDGVRPMEAGYQDAVDMIIKEFGLPYNLIEVPTIDIEGRVDFIAGKVREFQSREYGIIG